MIWHIFQKSLWDKTEKVERKKKILMCKNSLLIQILTPLLLALFPLRSLFRGTSMRVQIAQRASTGERQQKQVKWNILHYHQGSLLRLKSSALPSFRGSAQLQNVLPRDCVHTCKCAHARPSTCTHTHSKIKEYTKYGKGEKKQDLGCLWVCFTVTLFCFASLLRGREQGDWSNNQSVMWHFGEAFILHDSC